MNCTPTIMSITSRLPAEYPVRSTADRIANMRCHSRHVCYQLSLSCYMLPKRPYIAVPLLPKQQRWLFCVFPSPAPDRYSPASRIRSAVSYCQSIVVDRPSNTGFLPSNVDTTPIPVAILTLQRSQQSCGRDIGTYCGG